MADQFEGFDNPKENWCKLPNVLIEALPLIETVSEFKVITYILRHTWGYREDEKRITLDEFAHGRKRKDGRRIDNGTGLSIPSIRDGLKRAIEHGFVEHHQDDSDKARVKNFYSLKMRSGENLLQPECKEDSPGDKNSLPRTEKETLETNLEKETKSAAKNPPPARDYLTDVFMGNVNMREGEKLIRSAGWDIRSPEHRQAMAAFLEASRLYIPPDKPTRKDWLKSIGVHIQAYGVSQLEELYPRVVAQMREQRLSISRPGSVTNPLAALVGEMNRNGGKPHATPGRPATQRDPDETFFDPASGRLVHRDPATGELVPVS